MSRRSRIRRALLGSTALAASVVLLTGCSFVQGLAGGTNYDELKLKVKGPENAWMNAGYAGGLGEDLEVAGYLSDHSSICGIGENYIASQSTQGLGTTDVTLTDIATKTEFGHVENASCGVNGGSIDGTLFMTMGLDNGWQLQAVDLASGAMTPASEQLEGLPSSVTPLGGDGKGGVYLYALVNSYELFHFADGKLDWRSSVEPGDSCQMVTDKRIGCSGTEGYRLIDTKNGETIASGAYPTDFDGVVWALDGFAFTGNYSADDRLSPAYDLDGDPLEDMRDVYALSVPNPRTGALATLEDLTYLDVYAVSPKGHVLAYLGDDGLIATSTGDVVVHDTIPSVYQATAKGDAFVVDVDGTPTLVDDHGKDLGDLGASSVTEFDLVDGYLVTSPLDGPAVVHLPAK